MLVKTKVCIVVNGFTFVCVGIRVGILKGLGSLLSSNVYYMCIVGGF